MWIQSPALNGSVLSQVSNQEYVGMHLLLAEVGDSDGVDEPLIHLPLNGSTQHPE